MKRRDKPNLLKRLRGRTVQEFTVRGKQFLNAQAERTGISHLTRVPSDKEFQQLFTSDARLSARSPESLLEHFRTRTTPHFFPAFSDSAATSATLRERFSPNAQLMDKCNRILTGHFDLLGLTDLNFGSPINWHLEPLSGKVAPRVHWSQIDYLDPATTGDKKITWELNRHQYFATLGRFYWQTKDESYALAFSEHVLSWIEQNPPKVGVNWASSLEVGFRSISWLWAIYFFRTSQHFTAALLQSMLKLLYIHALHLESYLSTYFSPNTHLTGEALALFYLGLLLPEFRAAVRWRTLGEQILLSQLDRHVLPDGVYFEHSTYYHRYTADFYLHFLILLETNEQQVPAKLRNKLTQLLDHLLFITRPDGTTPLIGDDDGGRLMPLDDCALDDFRSTLATAAAVFGRSDYKFVSERVTEETLWLLGQKGLRTFDELSLQEPQNTSRAFRNGGYFVMRDAWSPTANYMVLDCGALGGLRYGHAHADALSFDLAARGRTLLVDPGTFTYTSSKQDRDYFRSSIAHNTLTVDGVSSSVPAGPFGWSHVANAEVLEWIAKDRFDFFSGCHDGYNLLQAAVKYRRDVLFLKNDYWLIIDHLESSGEHHYEMPFHFVESADPVSLNTPGWKWSRERPFDQPGLEIAIRLDDGLLEEHDGWVSRTYRQRSAAVVSTLGFKASSVQLITLLIPRTSAQPQVSAKTVESGGGLAFEVHDEGVRDLITIGASEVGSEGMKSDFDIAWLRFNPTRLLQELVLINGKNLTLADQPIVSSENKIQYVSAVVKAGGLEGDRDGSHWSRAILSPHDSSICQQ